MDSLSKMLLFQSRIPLLAAFIFVTSSQAAAQDMVSSYYPCSAQFAAPCARSTARKLAIDTVAWIEKQHVDGIDPSIYLSWITRGDLNLPFGFYPFVMTSEGVVKAHGARASLVGKSMDDIVREHNLITNATHWLRRFREANGSFVRYLFRLDPYGVVYDKTAYVLPGLDGSIMVAVGWVNIQLPTDSFCTAEGDSFCSLTNAQSIAGWAMKHLLSAESVPALEHAVTDISFQPPYRVPGYNDGNDLDDFVVSVYSSEGILIGNGKLDGQITKNVTDVFAAQGQNPADGLVFFDKLRTSLATEDASWFQYCARSASVKIEAATPKKRCFVVHAAKVSFEGRDYFLSSQFELATNELPRGLHNSMCTPHHAFPCSFQMILKAAAHSISYLISADGSPEDRFKNITYSDNFRPGGFYVFIYDSQSQNAVAHGDNATFVGKTLREVFNLNGLTDLDADQLYVQFEEAAANGGQYVAYDWLDPRNPDILFQKLSYLHMVEIGGKNYILGVGFSNSAAKVSKFISPSIGTRKNGDPIPCSSQFSIGLSCNEAISQVLIGASLSNIVLASSETQSTTYGTMIPFQRIEDVYDAIDEKREPFLINDFSVTVVSYDDSPECAEQDGTGCIVASSSDEFKKGSTWQQILDKKVISEISGKELNDRLMLSATQASPLTRVHWTVSEGFAKYRIFLAALFKHSGSSLYIFVVYDELPLPPTCDDCPAGFSCTSEDQQFCLKISVTRRVVFGSLVSFAIFLSLWITGRRIYFWRKKKEHETWPLLFGCVPWPGKELGPRPDVKKEEHDDQHHTPLVFICHRGPDTKEALARPTEFYLTHAVGVETFFDNESLQQSTGEDNTTRLLEAAWRCTYAIIIISPTFRESNWCVGELNIFMERIARKDKNFRITTVLWGVSKRPAGYPKELFDHPYVHQQRTDDPTFFLLNRLWRKLHLDNIPTNQELEHPYQTLSDDFVEWYAHYNRSRGRQSDAHRGDSNEDSNDENNTDEHAVGIHENNQEPAAGVLTRVLNWLSLVE